MLMTERELISAGYTLKMGARDTKTNYDIWEKEIPEGLTFVAVFDLATGYVSKIAAIHHKEK